MAVKSRFFQPGPHVTNLNLKGLRRTRPDPTVRKTPNPGSPTEQLTGLNRLTEPIESPRNHPSGYYLIGEGANVATSTKPPSGPITSDECPDRLSSSRNHLCDPTGSTGKHPGNHGFIADYCISDSDRATISGKHPIDDASEPTDCAASPDRTTAPIENPTSDDIKMLNGSWTDPVVVDSPVAPCRSKYFVPSAGPLEASEASQEGHLLSEGVTKVSRVTGMIPRVHLTDEGLQGVIHVEAARPLKCKGKVNVSADAIRKTPNVQVTHEEMIQAKAPRRLRRSTRSKETFSRIQRVDEGLQEEAPRRLSRSTRGKGKTSTVREVNENEVKARGHYDVSADAKRETLRGHVRNEETIQAEVPSRLKRKGKSPQARTTRNNETPQVPPVCPTTPGPLPPFADVRYDPDVDYESRYFRLLDRLRPLEPDFVPPRSPHCLLEETLYRDPWALLVSTIFLNVTSCKTARNKIFWFLANHPDPESVTARPPEALERYFVGLGLSKTRALQVWRMSAGYSSGRWRSAKELYGIGEYGDAAYRMFCLGDFGFEPSDRYLRVYREWYLKVGRYEKGR